MTLDEDSELRAVIKIIEEALKQDVNGVFQGIPENIRDGLTAEHLTEASGRLKVVVHTIRYRAGGSGAGR